MHRKPLRQQRPFPVPQMLHPFPSRTPRALPLPTPRPKLENLLSHLDWATLPHQYIKCNHKRAQRAPKSPIVPRPPTPARTPRNPPGLGNHRRESPAARPSTIGQERAFTVTVGADFHRRCAGTPPRHGKGSVTISATARGIHTPHATRPPAASTRASATRHRGIQEPSSCAQPPQLAQLPVVHDPTAATSPASSSACLRRRAAAPGRASARSRRPRRTRWY